MAEPNLKRIKIVQELLYGAGIFLVCVGLFGNMFAFGVICLLFAYFMTHEIPDIEFAKYLKKDKNNGNTVE